MGRIRIETNPTINEPRFIPRHLGHLEIDEKGRISGQITDPLILELLADEPKSLVFTRFRTTIITAPAKPAKESKL